MPDNAFADVDLVHRDTVGEPIDTLYRAAMEADLVIVEAGPKRTELCGAFELSDATRRGVLVIPGSATAMPGNRVAIRWDGTPQAASALRDSLPLLRDAECICIIDVEGSAGRGFMPSDAARYLERHGFDSYQVETYGCCLVEIVAHQNVDLVVGAGAPSFWSPRSPEQLAEALRVPILITA